MDSDFINDITNLFMNYINEKKLEDPHEISFLQRSVFDSISNGINMQNKSIENLIQAENAVIEIIDKDSGKLYRRYLELLYKENSNGLLIEGEDLSGKKSKIVFMSESAIIKVKDLNGKGLDTPPCK